MLAGRGQGGESNCSLIVFSKYRRGIEKIEHMIAELQHNTEPAVTVIHKCGYVEA